MVLMYTQPALCENVQYGPHERNARDFWQAKSAQSSPVLVSIHGGRFVAGNKSVQWRFTVPRPLPGLRPEELRGVVDWHATLRSKKRQAAAALLGHTTERRALMRYPEFLAVGRQIGSGPTEMMCKVTTLRTKRPARAGMPTTRKRSWRWRLSTKVAPGSPAGIAARLRPPKLPRNLPRLTRKPGPARKAILASGVADPKLFFR